MPSKYPFDLAAIAIVSAPPALRWSARSAATDGKVFKWSNAVLPQLSPGALLPNDFGSFSVVTQVGGPLPASTNNLMMVNNLPFVIEFATKSVRVN